MKSAFGANSLTLKPSTFKTLTFATFLFLSVALMAQSASTLPHLVRFNGTAKDLNGNPQAGTVGITFALYAEETGGSPLWMETQNVQADETGRYSVLLGFTKSQGLPPDLFTAEQAHWIGIQISGQPEQPRVLLVSAPYALKAGDAETIGGLPPSAFLLAPTNSKSSTTAAATPAAQSNAAPPPATVTGSGTTNYISKWTGTSTLGNSGLFQTGSGSTTKLGINTTSPADMVDVRGTGRFLVSTTLNALVGNQNGTGSAGNGVVGLTSATAGYGVYGFANNSSGTAIGVFGTTSSSSGYGGSFAGFSVPANSGLSGGPGVLITGGNGDPDSIGGVGGTGLIVKGGSGIGEFNGNGGNAIDATAGPGFGDVGDGIGGIFTGGNGALQGGDGIDTYGGSGMGIVAVGGNGNSPNGTTAGDGIDAYAGTDSNSYAGYFIGNVLITGTLSASTKHFLIDHPQDPANKYLVHASVESSEMMNIYTGNIVTDESGRATVQLPKWFEALNGDFRYQLTPIGQFAQAIVETEISNSQFTIRTDKPNVKVSWQVTAVRHDAYAKANPLVVEEAKSAKLRGYYVNPEAYGQSREHSIAFARHPETLNRMKQHQLQSRLAAKNISSQKPAVVK